jgi:hypothetical protein
LAIIVIALNGEAGADAAHRHLCPAQHGRVEFESFSIAMSLLVEGDVFRFFYNLKLQFDRLPSFRGLTFTTCDRRK